MAKVNIYQHYPKNIIENFQLAEVSLVYDKKNNKTNWTVGGIAQRKYQKRKPPCRKRGVQP